MNQRTESINVILWDWNGTLLDDVEVCIESMNSMLSKRKKPLLTREHYKEIFTFPVIDYYRKQKIKKILFSQSPKIESLLVTLLGPEEILVHKQERINIDTVFSQLPLSYQKIIKLKYIDGKSIINISKELSISFKSAESMLFRARKAFTKAWSQL